MLGQFVREGLKDVNIENGAANFVVKTLLPEAVDGVEVFAISTLSFFGWTSAVNHAADKKIAAENAKAEGEEPEEKEEKKGKGKKKEAEPKPEVVDQDGKPVN